MKGNDHFNAAEPNWLKQAHQQLSDLWLTLENLVDPTCLEACDRLEAALDDVSRQAARDDD